MLTRQIILSPAFDTVHADTFITGISQATVLFQLFCGDLLGITNNVCPGTLPEVVTRLIL